MSDRNYNIPIDNEISIGEGLILISRTDIKGNILYMSPDLLKLTGYTEKEVFQQNHNIIRHPDMPRSVFKDLWKTISQGQSWTGILKNRTKTGQGFWLDTTISPIISHKQIQGYISVRKYASSDSIQKYLQHMKVLENRNASHGLKKLILDIHYRISNISKLQSFIFLGLFIFLCITPFLDFYIQFFWIFFLLALTCFGNILFIERFINKKMETINSFSGSLSGGNFRPESYNLPNYTSNDIFINSIVGYKTLILNFNGLLNTLEENLKNQFKTYDLLNESSKKIDIFVRNISHSTIDKSTDISELSETMQAISKSINTQSQNILFISNNVNEISDIMVITAQYLEDMSVIIDKTLQRYEFSKDHVNSLMDDMEQMKTLSETMGSVIGVIDEISEKINLLSINAAIESARAGELGKGFAVVAKEVSSLSEKTALNVKSISNTIHSFRKSINDGSIKTKGVVHIFQEIQDLILSLSNVTNKVQESSLDQLEKLMNINNNVLEAKTEVENINQSIQSQNKDLMNFSSSISNLSDEAKSSINIGEQIRALSRKAYLSHKQLNDILNHFKS